MINEKSGDSACRIVIASGSPEERANLRSLLLAGSCKNIEFIEAETGAHCIEACLSPAHVRPDCILLDYQLPEYDAPALLKALGGPDCIRCPVLVITGTRKSSENAYLLGLGAQGYIGKGWLNQESLMRSVENCIERYKLNQELKDSHAQFRAFLENSSIIAWMKDEAGVYHYMSPNFKQRFGLENKARQGLTDQELWPPQIAENFRRHDCEVLLSNLPLELIEPTEEPEGWLSWWLTSKFPFVNQNGDRFVGGISIEITERIKAEQALRDSEELNRSILDNSADCIKIIDLEGKIVKMNQPGLCVMEIADFSLIQGKPWSFLWPAAAEGKIQKALAEARSGGVGRFKGFCPTARGTSKWWDVAITAVKDNEGNPKHFVSISRDITQQEEYASSLKSAAETDAYRISLSDALRPLTDPVMIQAAAARILGQHLQASRVHYGVLTKNGQYGIVRADYCNGVPSLAGKYRLDDYGPAIMAQLRTGKTLIIHDVLADLRLAPAERARTAGLGIGAYVAVCLRKNNRPVALFVVHQDRSRQWTDNEILLIEETADRTWATVERASAEAALRNKEEKLRLANQRFTAALEASPIVMFSQDVDLRYTWIQNSSLGLRIKDIFSKTDYDLLEHEASADRLTAIKSQVLQSGLPCRAEVSIFSNGEERWYDLSIQAQKTGNKIIGILGAAVDITRRKQEEEKIRQNELRLRLALDAAYLISFEWDIERNEVRRFVSIAPGLPPTPEEAPSTFEAVCQVVHPDDRDLFKANVMKALEPNNGYYENEFRLVNPGGQIAWLFERGRVEFDGEGRPRRLVGLSQDITKRKLAEEALQRYTEELQDADRRKNEFLAMLGHELRNPLTPISNVAQILSMAALDEQTLTWAREVLNRNVAHITQLVDDLLDVSRITRGLIALQKEKIELNRLLKESVESVDILIKSKCHTLNLHLAKQPVFLEGDPVRLTQVFTNLLNNAAKYSEPNGLIELTVSLEDTWAVVSIKDNGLGIEPRLLPHVFDLFTQGERSLARSEGGLGLGLSLVKKMVEMHGGEVSAHSQGAHQGAEFIVRLPRLSGQSGG